MRLLNFSQALDALKQGQKIAREGWNGKGMWLAMSTGKSSLPEAQFWNQHAKKFAAENGGNANILPSIIMKTADNQILIGWLASQSDLFAEDWCILP